MPSSLLEPKQFDQQSLWRCNVLVQPPNNNSIINTKLTNRCVCVVLLAGVLAMQLISCRHASSVAKLTINNNKCATSLIRQTINVTILFKATFPKTTSQQVPNCGPLVVICQTNPRQEQRRRRKKNTKPQQSKRGSFPER